MMVSEMANELATARITETDIAPTNSPAPPGMRTSGMNASIVVTVEPKRGTERPRTAS